MLEQILKLLMVQKFTARVSKENLTTDTNGATVLKNLYLGTYIVKEKQAPTGFYNAGEEKTVTLSYAGQNVNVVFTETTFTNDRQKAEVMVTKQDKDTENPLDGGIFGLYAASDITNADGTVIVKKGTLIQKATTGAMMEQRSLQQTCRLDFLMM